MKKNTYILVFLLISLGCKQINVKTNNNIEIKRDFNWAKQEFKHDSADQLMLIRVGIPNPETDDYFWSILKDDYNIGIKFGVGCFVDSGTICYNKLMKEAIFKKYGTDFFKIIHLRIDSIYQIDKPLIQKIKSLDFIDSSKILNYKVYNTPDLNIKVVSGFGWREINKKFFLTNLFRVTIDCQTLKIKNIDRTIFGIEPYKE